MASSKPNPSLTARELLSSWGRILTGKVPMLSIEITRECPLTCPGCYAYGDTHLGNEVTLRELHDLRGDALVDGVVNLVRKHKPLHVSLVGGEPLVRHRELSRILPALSELGVYTLVVTSAVIPIPVEWMKIPRVRVAVSIDGLPVVPDYAGLAPGNAGLYQVNVRIPNGTRFGNNIPVVLSLGGKQSNTVTVAVQ